MRELSRLLTFTCSMSPFILLLHPLHYSSFMVCQQILITVGPSQFHTACSSATHSKGHTGSGFPSSLSYFLFLCLGLTHITYRDMKTAIALASVATAYFFIVSQYRYLYLYSTGFQMYHIVVWSLNLCVFHIDTQQNKESASPDGQWPQDKTLCFVTNLQSCGCNSNRCRILAQ